MRHGHLQVGVAGHERARVDERVVGRRGGGEEREEAVDAPRVGELAQLDHLRLGERVEDACVVAGREVARAWSGVRLRLTLTLSLPLLAALPPSTPRSKTLTLTLTLTLTNPNYP